MTPFVPVPMPVPVPETYPRSRKILHHIFFALYPPKSVIIYVKMVNGEWPRNQIRLISDTGQVSGTGTGTDTNGGMQEVSIARRAPSDGRFPRGDGREDRFLKVDAKSLRQFYGLDQRK